MSETMKKNILLKVTFLILAGVVFIQTACKKITTDDLSINVNTDVFNAPTLISFENAKAGANNQPTEFKLTISGPDKDKITTSESSTNFSVHDSWIALQLVKGVEATSSKPINFTIYAEVPGFEPVRKEISLVSNTESKIVVKVIEKGNLPTGIVEKESDFTLKSGEFEKNEEIFTGEENGVTETVKLNFDAGTFMYDKNGNKITGSNLKAKVRYYDISDQSIEVFPGGLSPKDVVDKDGKKIEGGINFFTAGLADIDLSVNGVTVKKFSKPISAEIELNEKLDNYITGEPVKVGDSIPLWSYDEETGQWTEENKYAKVELAANGSKVAKFKIDHLSPWNMDWGWNQWWWWWWQSFFANFSWLNINVNAPWSTSGSNGYNYGNYGYSYGGSYGVYTRTTNGNYLTWNWGYLWNGRFGMSYYSRNIPQYVEVYDYEQGIVVARSPIFNPRQQSSITVDIPKPSFKFVDVNLNYSVKCASNAKLNPNRRTWVYVQDLNTYRTYYYYTGSKGILNMRLIDGHSYRITTRGIYGEIISCQTKLDIKNVNKTNIEKINGLEVKKLEYNPTSNSVDVECLYTLPKC
jgi:hypothetical protein